MPGRARKGIKNGTTRRSSLCINANNHNIVIITNLNHIS
jgi:hypothetical protein